MKPWILLFQPLLQPLLFFLRRLYLAIQIIKPPLEQHSNLLIERLSGQTVSEKRRTQGDNTIIFNGLVLPIAIN